MCQSENTSISYGDIVQGLSIPLFLYCIGMNGLSIVSSSVVKSQIMIKALNQNIIRKNEMSTILFYISLFWKPVILSQVS